MTRRKSEREVERALEDLRPHAGTRPTFAEWREWVGHSIAEHGSYAAGPSLESFVDRDVALDEATEREYFRRFMRAQDRAEGSR